MGDGGWAVVEAPIRKNPPLPFNLRLPILTTAVKMPPRGSEGLNFSPILTHYLFLFTSILSVVRIPNPPPFRLEAC